MSTFPNKNLDLNKKQSHKYQAQNGQEDYRMQDIVRHQSTPQEDQEESKMNNTSALPQVKKQYQKQIRQQNQTKIQYKIEFIPQNIFCVQNHIYGIQKGLQNEQIISQWIIFLGIYECNLQNNSEQIVQTKMLTFIQNLNNNILFQQRFNLFFQIFTFKKRQKIVIQNKQNEFKDTQYWYIILKDIIKKMKHFTSLLNFFHQFIIDLLSEGSVSINERGYFFINEIIDCADDNRLSLPFIIWPIQKGDKFEYELHKTICAFLNMQGGIILLGINKKTKSVQGIRVTDQQKEVFQTCLKSIRSQFYPTVEEDEIRVDYFPIRHQENKQIILQEQFVVKIRVNQGKMRDRLYKWPYSIDPVSSVTSTNNSRFVAENKSIVSYKRDGELNKRLYYIEQEEEIIHRARNPVPLAEPIEYPPPTYELILAPYILQIFDIPFEERRKKIIEVIYSKFQITAEEHGQHIFIDSKKVPSSELKNILEFSKQKEGKMYADLGAKKIVIDGKARVPPHNSENLVVINNSLSSKRDEYQKKLEQCMTDNKIQYTSPLFQHRIVYSVSDLDEFKSKMQAEKNNLKSYCFENKFEIVKPQKQLDLYNIEPSKGHDLKEEIDQLFEGLNIEKCDQIDLKGFKLQYFFSDPYEMLIANDRIKNTSTIKKYFKEQQIKIFMPYNDYIQ